MREAGGGYLRLIRVRDGATRPRKHVWAGAFWRCELGIGSGRREVGGEQARSLESDVRRLPCEDRVRVTVCGVVLLVFAVAGSATGQNVDAGRATFVSRCASCHGTDANGGELGPAITTRVPTRTDADLLELIRDGRPAAGMPGFPNVTAAQAGEVIAFLRTLKPRAGELPQHRSYQISGGPALAGLVLNHTTTDVQLLGDDHRLHLLRGSGTAYREVTTQTDWTVYNGSSNGTRYSALKQIDSGNVAQLAPRWMFTVPNGARLQVTPVVAGGVMYVTVANEAWALDAGTGREIWHYQRPRTRGLVGNAAGGVNRGVAVAGDRLFMVTDHAHLIALNRHTGALLWETVMADWHQNYNATGAPLIVNDLVVTGTSGGDEGVRGFVAAFDQATGKEAWRFWTVPAPGEPKAETTHSDSSAMGSSTRKTLPSPGVLSAQMAPA